MAETGDNLPTKGLGDVLLEEGMISEGQLREAREKANGDASFIGKVLMEMKYITEYDLTNFLVKKCKIPHISLMDYTINEQMLKTLPKDLCLKHRMLPVDQLGQILTVAMVDPLDTVALSALREARSDLRIKPILCTWQHYEHVARTLFPDGVETVSTPLPDDEMSIASLGLTSAPPKKKKAEKKKNTEGYVLDGPASQVISGLLQQAVEEMTKEERAARPEFESEAKFIEAIEGSIRESVAQGLENARVKIQDMIFCGQGALPADGAKLLATVKKALTEALDDAAGTLLYDTQSALAESKAGAAALTTQQLTEILRLSMRQALQDASADVLQMLAKSLSEQSPY